MKLWVGLELKNCPGEPYRVASFYRSFEVTSGLPHPDFLTIDGFDYRVRVVSWDIDDGSLFVGLEQESVDIAAWDERLHELSGAGWLTRAEMEAAMAEAQKSPRRE